MGVVPSTRFGLFWAPEKILNMKYKMVDFF